MRYYIIAGEPSGDLHGANLMKGLKRHDPQAGFRFWGGDRMAAEGGTENLVEHYRNTSFFGIWEVIRNARTILGQIDRCKRDIADYAPDVLILIDYPGFNMKMAEFAHNKGIRTFYYIAPKVWAWKEYRVKKIKRWVDRLFIIFPFEIDYFRRWGLDAVFEGNPLCDALAQQMESIPPADRFREQNGLGDKPIVALLAGSRRSEIRNNMPFMAELAGRFPDYQFVVAGVSWLERSLYEEILDGTGIGFVENQTYALLAHSEAAVVTSGTATLETALIGTPEVVCYRTNRLSYIVGRMFIKGKFISLVNLIMDRETVRELIQGDMNMENATAELAAILPGGAKREAMEEDFRLLRDKVGGSGTSDRVAARMVEELKLQASK